MARTRALSDLIADVRSRANMETSTFVTDAEITEWLNQELAELHIHLVTNEGQPHFRQQQNLSVLQNVALYPLPSDFYRVQRITANISGYNMDLEPFMESERASLLNSTIYGYVARGSSPMYRVQGSNLEILPATRAYSATLFYVQRCPRLVSGTDTTDGFDGYEMAAICGATAIALQKEESDASLYLAHKVNWLRLVDSAAPNRDASHPERVADVTGDLDNTMMPWLWR